MKKLIVLLIICVFAFNASADPIYRPNAEQQSGTFAIDACIGSVIGVSCINKFGANADIDLGSSETVWSTGGLYPWASVATAQAVEIVSSDANDTSAGTGARTVEVQGLDANWDLQTETVTLNGTTAVDLTNTFLRVFRMKVLTAGSGNANAGTIILRLDGAGDTLSTIEAGDNQTLMALYSVPRKHKLVIKNVLFNINGANGTDVEFEIYARQENSVFQIKKQIGLRGSGNSAQQLRFYVPEVFNAKTDIDIRANTDANNTEVAASFDAYLVRVEE